MPRRPEELEQRLQTKFGFIPATGRDEDHRWWELRLEGLPPIRTFFSRSKPISKGLEDEIAHQLHVRGPYLRGMIDCTNSREDYYWQVRYAPYPPFRHYSPPPAALYPEIASSQLEAIQLPKDLIVRAFGNGDSAARAALLRTARQEVAAAYQAAGLPVPDDLQVTQLAQALVITAEQHYYNTLT
jgi:hypothetical protein